MSVDRRQFLAMAATGAAVTSCSGTAAAALASSVAGWFNPAGSAVPGAAGGLASAAGAIRYCLNTSTIRGQDVGIQEEIRIAAEAGYDGIEPWIGTIRKFVEGGGRLQDLRAQIEEAGLTVESAIGFAQWIVDDPEQRRKALDEARRDMELLKEIGGLRIAAPPSGANQGPKIELPRIAERYRALLEVGDDVGIVPQLEVWGFSANLSRLADSTWVVLESAHPRACLLPDVYHLHKGGSDFGSLSLLSDSAIQVFHMNDYPNSPPREDINDSHRVYPGDGVAPLDRILQAIAGEGHSVTLSLELFNREYWEQDALSVATTGLQKMRSSVAHAFG